MQLTNLYFLPQKDDSLLINLDAKINALNIMLFFTLETFKALEIFIYEKEKITCFDPHVGDTCCQIRAYRMFLLSKKPHLEYKFFLKNIGDLTEKLKEKIAFLKNVAGNQHIAEKEMAHKSQKLCDFFSKNGLTIQLPGDIFFLASSFFLTQFKLIDNWGNTYINLDSVEKRIGISRKLAKKIVRDHQLKLAHDSISFIEYLQHNIACDFLSSFNFSHLIKNDDNDRTVLPCYLIMRFLFDHMMHEKTPILFIINRQIRSQHLDTIFIIFIDSFNYIHLTENSISDCAYAGSTSVVIQGILEYPNENCIETEKNYIERLMQIGLKTIIFANMAYHPQYSGDKLAHLSSNPFRQNTLIATDKNIERCTLYKKEKELGNELKKMQGIATNIGCCDVNRSLFFIRHIYCDIISSACAQICLESVA